MQSVGFVFLVGFLVGPNYAMQCFYAAFWPSPLNRLFIPFSTFKFYYSPIFSLILGLLCVSFQATAAEFGGARRLCFSFVFCETIFWSK